MSAIHIRIILIPYKNVELRQVFEYLIRKCYSSVLVVLAGKRHKNENIHKFPSCTACNELIVEITSFKRYVMRAGLN